MTTLDLIKKYPDVDPQILSQYKKPEKFIIFNDDTDLHKIKVDLPEPPEYHKIDGFGLPAKKQKFQRQVLPEKLSKLQRKFETLDEANNEIENNREYYKSEIKFIRKQWYRLLNGYWFFNNGVPTYIDGWHYFYITWWKIDIGYPEYRSRDRKFWIFARFCYKDTFALYHYRILHQGKFEYFATKDNAATFCRQWEIPFDRIQEGMFFIDKINRVCFGFIYPKYRREGATFKAGCLNYCITIVHQGTMGGIQSMTDDDAKKVFRKAIISPWKKLPFFFKPKYEGSTDPKTELSFNPPATRLSSRGSKSVSEVGLESIINFAIADGSGYDGQKLCCHHRDEGGKLEHPIDIVDCHNITKECLSENMGQHITGLGIVTSTVGKMDLKKGGPRFKEFCNMSRYEIRDDNGQTITGYYVCFLPAEDGIVVDEYGNSVIEDPKEPVYDKNGRLITRGGRSILMNKRKLLIAQQNFEELAREKRKFPNKFSECFSSTGKESGLPIGKIEFRLEELAFNNPQKVRGNFYWVNGEFGGRVEFERDPLGKWYLSKRLLQSESNKKFWDDDMQSWVPGNKNKYVLGVDPFRFKVTNDARRSKGAGAVFYKHDASVDPSDNPKDWKYSNRCVCTYSFRTFDKITFFQDMLMMAIYFGAGVYPEINVPDIWDYFDEKGFTEYMIYKYDKRTGKQSKTPGEQFGNNSLKDEMMIEYANYYNNFISNDPHDEVMEQAKGLNGVDDIRNNDLFAAFGWALIGAKRAYDFIDEQDNENDDLADYFPQYKRN